MGQIVPVCEDLRALESPRLTPEAIQADLVEALRTEWPGVARALTAPEEVQRTFLPAPPREPVIVRGLLKPDSGKVGVEYALFSPEPAGRVEFLYLREVWEALAKVSAPDRFDEAHDLVVVAADQWLRRLGHFWEMSGVEPGQGPLALKVLEDTLRGYGVRFGHALEGGRAYCGSLLTTLANRPESSRWAGVAFVTLLEQGMVTDCGYDFGYLRFTNDLFAPVIRHGEGFLGEYPGSSYWPAVALRVALAHETAWSVGKSFPEDYPEESRNGDFHRTRAVQLYEAVSARSPSTKLKEAIQDRLRDLRRNRDTGCRVYYLELGC